MTELIVFDVNETLSDLSPLNDVFAEVGLAGQTEAWFASVLRDGFALAVTGEQVSFATIAHASVASRAGMTSADRVLQAFMELPVHPDVVEGLRNLRAAGHRLVTLSNGGTAVAERLLERAGVLDEFEQLLTVEDAPLWKPAASAYQYALDTCGVAAQNAALVAVHPWDIHGAQQAGLRGCYLNRKAQAWPSWLPEPDLQIPDLTALATLI